jgi:hypothetical protein
VCHVTSLPEQFPFIQRDPAIGAASLAPLMPISLTAGQTVDTTGLLDSGATVNVLPYTLGIQLGFDWDAQKNSVQLSGNLAMVEARVVVVTAQVATFAPVKLAFAWAKSDSIPVLLGQVNFFAEFDVCFFRSPAYLKYGRNRYSSPLHESFVPFFVLLNALLDFFPVGFVVFPSGFQIGGSNGWKCSQDFSIVRAVAS